MGQLFTVRDALHHIMGKDLAESIIADKGPEWAKVAAVSDLSGKERLDHIERWFLARMAWEQGRIDDGTYYQAEEEFRQNHRAMTGVARHG